MSSSVALSLDVIPAVTVLLLKETDEDQNYENYFTYSFSDREQNPLFSTAVLLDPK